MYKQITKGQDLTSLFSFLLFTFFFLQTSCKDLRINICGRYGKLIQKYRNFYERYYKHGNNEKGLSFKIFYQLSIYIFNKIKIFLLI